MLIESYKGEILDEEIKKFYNSLSQQFINQEYSFIDDNYMGKYRLPKEIIKDMYPNVDFDYLIYTKEGEKEQDELVLNYHTERLFKEVKEFCEKYVDTKIYVEENMEYLKKYKAISFEKIKEKNKDTIFKEYEDYRKKTIDINLAALIASIHMFGIKKVKEFIEEKKSISVDEKYIPITFYFIYFKEYNISDLFNLKEEKVVLQAKNEEEKKYIEKLKESEKEIFEGQQSEEKIEDVLKKVNDLKLLEKLLNIVNQKKRKKDKIEDDERFGNIKKGKERPNFKDYEDQNKKYFVKNNDQVNKILKDKYESEYKKEPSKYLEDTTNRKID